MSLLISTLRTVLAQAEAGEVVAVGLVAIPAKGDAEVYVTGPYDRQKLQGGIHDLSVLVDDLG